MENLNRKIQDVELEINEVVEAQRKAEIDASELSHLREREMKLRRKEEQLRDERLLQLRKEMEGASQCPPSHAFRVSLGAGADICDPM